MPGRERKDSNRPWEHHYLGEEHKKKETGKDPRLVENYVIEAKVEFGEGASSSRMSDNLQQPRRYASSPSVHRQMTE